MYYQPRDTLAVVVVSLQVQAKRGLSLIRPNSSPDFGCYGMAWFNCSQTKQFYINTNHNPEVIHNRINPKSNRNPSHKQSNSCLTSLSRVQNSFLLILLQGSISSSTLRVVVRMMINHSTLDCHVNF